VAERRPKFMGGWAILAALALIAALAVLESRSRADVMASAGWVSHTLQVENELATTRTLLADAETGQRGYLLTQDPAYLQPNEQATAAIPGSFAHLLQLTADNPGQHQRIEEMARLADARLAVLHETIAVAKAGGRERAIQMVIEGKGTRLMADLQTQMQSAVNEEERLLRERQSRLAGSVRQRGLEAQILIGVMGAGLIAIAFLLIHLNRVHDAMMIIREGSAPPA
jgi:CHASE3 domain sensor protein